MNDLFDELVDIPRLGDAKSYVLNFERYFPEYLDVIRNLNETPSKRLCIIGAKQKDMTSEVSASSPEILLSLINLAKTMKEKNLRSEETGLLNETIEWCNKFGLPYFEPFTFKKGYPDTKTGFIFSEFKRKLDVFHSIFSVWQGIKYDDYEKIIKYSSILACSQQTHKIEELKNLLAIRINCEMNLEVNLIYNASSDSFSVIHLSANQFVIAYYQLSLALSGSYAFRGIGTCTMCNRVFELKHGNQKICPECKINYNALRMREKRDSTKLK